SEPGLARGGRAHDGDEVGHGSAAVEAFLELIEPHAEVDRTAMGTVASEVDRVHLRKQCIRLLFGEIVAGPHRTMACHPYQNGLDGLVDPLGPFEVCEVVDRVAHHLLVAGASKNSWHRPEREGV